MFLTTIAAIVLGATAMSSQRPEPQSTVYCPAGKYASVPIQGRGTAEWKAFEQSIDLGSGSKVDLVLIDPTSQVLVAKGFDSHTEQGGLYAIGARVTYTCKPLNNPAYAPMGVPYHIVAHNEQGDREGTATGLYNATVDAQTASVFFSFDGPFTGEEVENIEIQHDILSYADGECEIRVHIDLICTRIN